jgi:hypothetical protein
LGRSRRKARISPVSSRAFTYNQVQFLTAPLENRLGSRGQPKCDDDQTPNCDLVRKQNRCVVSRVVRRPACQLGNNAGGRRQTSMKWCCLGLVLHSDTRPRQNRRDSHGPPRCPGHPNPNCSLAGRESRYAVSLTAPDLAHSLGNRVHDFKVSFTPVGPPSSPRICR